MSPFFDRLRVDLRARLRHAGPMLLAFASGAIAVLGFAPVSFFPIAVVAMAGLLESLSRCSRRQGFWRGYAFGLGLMGFGVAWIRISLNEFGNMDLWVADLMMVLFVGLMALYYGLTGWLVRALDTDLAWSAPVLLFPGIYVLFEWLRGWLFTGFPWLNLGYTQIESPLDGFFPVVGVYGVSLVTALSGALLWGIIRWKAGARFAAGAALIALWLAGLGLARVEWTSPSGTPITASVLQANIPQALKWDPRARADIMESYVDMTLAHPDSDLILWPETAIPDFLHEVREVLIEPLALRARRNGSEIVIGIPVLDQANGRYYNALVSLGSQEDIYAKRHLVPFGEFMPFKEWLGPIVELFEVPMSNFSPGTNVRPLLKVGKFTVGVSICYEDAFPNEVIQALPDAAFLVTVSNDAWFGDSLAPDQHLDMARARAMETGRDMVRATNTGISALINHRGRILGQVPTFVQGPYTGPVQPRSGTTPFVWWGNWLAILFASAMVVSAMLLRRWVRR